MVRFENDQLNNHLQKLINESFPWKLMLRWKWIKKINSTTFDVFSALISTIISNKSFPIRFLYRYFPNFKN